MSTSAFTADDDLEREDASLSALFHTSESLHYALTHIFLPIDLPSCTDYALEKDLLLVRAACAAARAYSNVCKNSEPEWPRITRMLDNLRPSIQSEVPDGNFVVSELRRMRAGDVLTFFISRQNAAITLTGRGDFTLFEPFEVSPREDAVERTPGSLICSYPWSAIEVPNDVFLDQDFQREFAKFLSLPSAGNSGHHPPASHPQYITALLSGILRSVGRPADVPFITKRIRDHVGRPQKNDSTVQDERVWRRSSLWLLVRLAIQMSIDRSSLGRASFKRFMLFFICTFARNARNQQLSNELLHLITSKILRRLRKLGSSTPAWLSDMALDTCACLREILDSRWMQLQPVYPRPYLFQNPSQDELARDTQLSLGSREYISSALENSQHDPLITPFYPNHRRRGTIDDFLCQDGAKFFDDAYLVDPDTTLYDIEKSVEQEVDEWVTHVTNVDDACAQLEVLMDRYLLMAQIRWRGSPEDSSITALTALELFISLDMLVINEVPMLAEYSPEIQTGILETLLLRRATSLRRLSRAYQYISMRHSRSHLGFSLLSDEFTEDSFPVRYYDQSSRLQHLKERIQQDSTGLLPTFPLHAKVVTFELQCPECIRIWRSAASRVVHYFRDPFFNRTGTENKSSQEFDLLARVSALKPYFVTQERASPAVQFHIALFHPEGSKSSNSPTLRYLIQHPTFKDDFSPSGDYGIVVDRENYFSLWRQKEDCLQSLFRRTYRLANHGDCSSCQDLAAYVDHTSHTVNDVLAVQSSCPPDLSIEEFIAFANLRSGGLLQWVNILWGLRSRTLNFRRHHVHYLLSHAIFQVGPLDLDTGTWIWHQELQDSYFCNALLDELDNLFVEAGSGSIDGTMMSTISILLTRVLVSSPSEGVSKRAVALLQRVRKKTFNWVQELSYNLAKAPVNKERSSLLLDMAAICRSTFDVDSATIPWLFQSAEDIDAAISCILFIHALLPERIIHMNDPYSMLLFQRDRHLSFALEESLRNAILVDTSDYSVDLAVRKVFASHKPSAHKWKHLQHADSRWFTCRTKVTTNQPSQTVHFNVLDGTLRVDARPIGGLPHVIRNNPIYQEIFRHQGFFVIPSNLPGTDFTTLSAMSKRKVHFSLRDDNLVIRAQCNESNDILELIPAGKLVENLPLVLLQGHVHWLNLTSKIIEIRPLEQLWDSSSEHWKIDWKSKRCRVYRGLETLVDIQSPTWATVSKCFECLNFEAITPGTQTRSLLITTSPVDPFESVPTLRLSVALPRSGLSFFVNAKEEIESRDFKDMVYDENQCVGALFGIENLLILRQKTNLPEELIPKHVLIPNDRFVKDGDFWVRIDAKYYPLYNESDEPLYHIYKVDTELGCLVGNGSSAAIQHLARLHAMTSCDRPDLLTGKTGAQAALHLLQSAGCRSIMKRQHTRVNFWDWKSQYPQIKAACDRIERSYSSNHFLYDELVGTSDKHAMRRAAYLFPWDATGATSDDCEDMEYLARASDLELEGVSFATAFAVWHWARNAPAMNTILDCATMCGGHGGAPQLPFLSEPMAEHATNFKTLHDVVQKGLRGPFQLPFLLPAMAYCSPCHQAAFLSMLIMFAQRLDTQSLHNVQIHSDMRISDGYRPTKEVIWDHFRQVRLKDETWHESNLEMEKYVVDAVADDLLKDWPSDVLPVAPHWLSLDMWDVASLTASLRQLFSSCYCNFKLKERLICLLAEPGSSTFLRTCPVSVQPNMSKKRVTWQITLDQLFSDRPAPELPSRNFLPFDNHIASPDDTSQMNPLLSSISKIKSNSTLQREYIAFLQKSARCVREERSFARSLHEDNRIATLEQHYVQCRVSYLDALAALQKSLGPTADPRQQALSRFAQWPPITADVLLRRLSSTSTSDLSKQWKKCIILFALLLLDLQHARRMLRLAFGGLEEELSKELEGEGCEGWDPEEYPDWLLIQIQGNFMIRRAQARIAMEMISPESGENTVMQVKMGEGKSSVIIPIAAAVLANGAQLVRVVVPKALTAQMFDLLVSRLGGLTSRPIYFLPFSRPTKSTRNKDGFQNEVEFDINDVQNITRHCMAKRGVLLVQPEHVASLKLMSVEQQIRTDKRGEEAMPNIRELIYKHMMIAMSLKLPPQHSLVGDIFRWLSRSPNRLDKKDALNADSCLDNASKWFDLQTWFCSHARDIIDESDEVLHARFQLIYTVGLPQHTDGFSDRWTITQQVLHLVKKHAYSISRYALDLIEYESGLPASFPYIHILRPSDVSRSLVSLIVEDVMADQLPHFKFQGIPTALQDAIRSFISDEDILQVPDTAKRVEEYAKSCSQQVWSGLLLLRGLLCSNILSFVLAERRWRVDYGLISPPKYSSSPTPTMLAVPYRAKDVPALNTHFGHPDITIILTCLSYYYGGLNEKQLRASFEILLDEDDPSIEYALWIKDYDNISLPDSLRTLSEINLRSSEQWDKVIFPLFTRNQAAIDFYLSRVVFPQEMKEYPWKLCGSSWDLAEKRERPITGFSGTNDGRWLLPMSITQRDFEHHQGTNAKVLTYLLQPENNAYVVTHESGQSRSTLGLLQLLVAQQPDIRVLLDVGAHILDFSNLQVAKLWLKTARYAAGAVYFNKDDELMILMRNGFSVPLQSSLLSQQLGRCIVYLDHAHTRGTDIVLPIGSRAAVTLGPKVTKDRLVQGCMRMRKLGLGHSVMFFAPPEVDRSIRALVSKEDPKVRVTTVDILSWAINETWTEIQKRAPYWAQQGMDHKLRYAAWSDFASRKITREKLADVWLQPELKSLVDLYAPSEAKLSSRSLSRLDPEIRQRCKNLGVLSLPSAEMTEEQEREVNREREREREVELPPKADPAEHFLHPDVIRFVNTGDIPPLNASNAFLPVFTTLENSSAAAPEANVWSPFILATVDFCSTIKLDSTQGSIDQYLRPVQWVLTRKTDRQPLLVLLSPFEVHRLMPDIRASEHVHLHVYAPRTSERMKPSDDLTLYSIPPLPPSWTPPWHLIDQLNIFAGQLYLRDYQSYLRLCHFFGIPSKDSPDSATVRWNLFNIPGSIEENEIRFSGSPLPSVMALLSIRNRGRPFIRTHMGQILQGRLLTTKDFEKTELTVSGRSAAARDKQKSREVTVSLEMLPPSPAGMACDAVDTPGLSFSPRSPKRSLEPADISDGSAETPKKRLRIE